MSYTIYNADGTQNIVPDGAIDLTFYDSTNKVGIQLVGRNAIDFGQPTAQNLLQMVENFAGPNTPGGNGATAPVGMLWYDNTNSLLKLQTASNVWSPVVTTDTNGILTTSTDIYVHGSTSTGVRVGFGNSGISTNTVVGVGALANNLIGTHNIAIGYHTLQNANNFFNTAVGSGALSSISVSLSNSNTAIGYNAIGVATDGKDNTALGNNSLANFGVGTGNTALGNNALYNYNSGSYNTVVGANTALGITTGANNTVIGAKVTGLAGGLTDNIIIANGTGAIKAQHDGTNWTLTGTINGAVTNLANGTAGQIPYQTGPNATAYIATGTAGQVLTSNGTGAPVWAAGGGGGGVSTVSVVTANGVSGIVANPTTTPAITLTLGAITPSSVNSITVGLGAGTNTFNTAIGVSALNANTSGVDNTAVGYESLHSNTTGQNNTALGGSALHNNTTGGQNTAIGSQSMPANTTGGNNTAVGEAALHGNSVGNANSAFGSAALFSNTGGYYNTAIGNDALSSNQNGQGNTSVGQGSLNTNTAGQNNTVLGFNSGIGITTGSGNTVIGANVGGLSSTLANNIIIANGAGTIKAQHNGFTDWDFKTNTISNVVDPVNPQDVATKNYVDSSISNINVIQSTSRSTTNLVNTTSLTADPQLSGIINLAANTTYEITGMLTVSSAAPGNLNGLQFQIDGPTGSTFSVLSEARNVFASIESSNLYFGSSYTGGSASIHTYNGTADLDGSTYTAWKFKISGTIVVGGTAGTLIFNIAKDSNVSAGLSMDLEPGSYFKLTALN